MEKDLLLKNDPRKFVFWRQHRAQKKEVINTHILDSYSWLLCSLLDVI